MSETTGLNSQCVVLVPVGHLVERDCELALRELEKRGYPVWRVYGYSAIDQARNQLATNALDQGFAELMWIDADVAFFPDDVDRLRAHQVPFSCGLYPKKGRRAFACNFLSDSSPIRFGRGGGLIDVSRVGFGFTHVRREVFERIREHERLPVCNEVFGERLIPFFQPLVVPDPVGQSYLAEDFAFCERAQRAGYTIQADTRIRLWHVGSYRYGWEDAGRDVERFGDFTFHLQSKVPTQVPSSSPGVETLRKKYPWPSEKPSVPPPPSRNWLFPSTKDVLAKSIPREAAVIVELGSFTGRSTRYLLELAPQATILAVDHWRGSSDMQNDAEVVEMLPRLYETFLSECWLWRERIVPVRQTTLDGLREIAAAGVVPDAIYLDADHSYEAVRADLALLLERFPHSRIIGDDWDWPGVQQAVREVASQHSLQVEVHGVGWRILRR